MSRFIHLNLHSEYSLVDGIIKIKDLLQLAVDMKMPALAITDIGNMFSAVKFYESSIEYGIKPVIGAEIRLIGNDDNIHSRLILLIQNLNGYHNLCKLLTKSYIEGQKHGICYIHKDWLYGNTDDLIALSGGKDGNIGQAVLADNMDKAVSLIKDWHSLFPDRYYLELHRTNRNNEEKYLHNVIQLGIDTDIPFVATNDVRFLKREDYEAHEARICIQHGYTLNDSRRPDFYSQEQYLRSPEEIEELFSDIPEAIENSWYISQRCNLELTLGKNYLPHFPVPDEKTQDEWLLNEAKTGLKNRLENNQLNTSIYPWEVYEKRLNTELEVITSMGFPGYFLIVADFIKWAKEKGIPVGPGRGSGAGSLVAYALGITELNPLEYDLLFERFLNPERISLPDFDVDFCMERRDEVIEYVSQRYGKEHVAQIITHGTMAAKAVVRDVGRVLGYPYGFVDQIAKLIPFEINMTLKRALAEDEILKKRYEVEEEVTILIDLAIKLEGLSRNAGKHAGGVVIAPEPLIKYMPLYCEQGSNSIVTQYDMGDVEAIGLVKFDFLGLRTLTIIDWAIIDINNTKPDDNKLEINNIPLDDIETYKLIRRTETTAIFQLESDGMKKLIKRLQPDNFNDLIALVALFRPGPLQSGMVDDFVDRKHGRAVIRYPHPDLEEILKPTYGVILYQEQVMEIAQALAGYTLGAADILRRAMGKKKPEEMAEQREIFISGAVNNSVEQKTAAYIFDLMEKFAGYGFNKSHSAAYALVAYQTAWLKTHYPAAFMAAVLSSDMDNTDKVVLFLDELRNMKIDLMPPDINESNYNFTVAGSLSIRYGLGAIKGVGKAAVENIIIERNEHGKYNDLFDLCKRVDLRKVNRRVLESLTRSGAFDKLGPGRSCIMASIDKALHFSEQFNQNNDLGQEDMFGLAPEPDCGKSDSNESNFNYYNTAVEWTDDERLIGEKETLGFYLKGHPIIRYEEELKTLITSQLKNIKPGNIITAGFIQRIRMRAGIKGRMAELVLDDRTARSTVIVYSDKYQYYRNIIIKDQLIVVKGEVVADDYLDSGYSITAKEIFDINQIREKYACLKITICNELEQKNMVKNIRDILLSYRSGNCPVMIEYENRSANCILNLGETWRINISDNLLDILKNKLGESNVSVNYQR